MNRRWRAILVALLAIALLPPLAGSSLVKYRAFLPSVARKHTSPWHDDFDGTMLHGRWTWTNEDPSDWSLIVRPGFLRIITHDLGGPGAENLLQTEPPAGDYTLGCRVLFEPHHNFLGAGLVVNLSNGFLMLQRAFSGFHMGNAIYFDHFQDGQPQGSNYPTGAAKADEVYLRLSRQGQVYTGYMSVDGVDWTVVGVHTVPVGVTATGIGVGCGGDIENVRTPADFDFVELMEGVFTVVSE
jgi:beta-xylosidase